MCWKIILSKMIKIYICEASNASKFKNTINNTNNPITTMIKLNRQHGLISVHLVTFIKKVICNVLFSSFQVFFSTRTSTFFSVTESLISLIKISFLMNFSGWQGISGLEDSKSIESSLKSLLTCWHPRCWIWTILPFWRLSKNSFFSASFLMTRFSILMILTLGFWLVSMTEVDGNFTLFAFWIWKYGIYLFKNYFSLN